MEQSTPTDEVFITSYLKFLTTNFGQSHVATSADDLQRAELYISQENIDDDHDQSISRKH